jgi:hypothetical protein
MHRCFLFEGLGARGDACRAMSLSRRPSLVQQPFRFGAIVACVARQ